MFRQPAEPSEFKYLLYFYYYATMELKVLPADGIEKSLKQFLAAAKARKPQGWINFILEARTKAEQGSKWPILDFSIDQNTSNAFYHALANHLALLFRQAPEGQKFIDQLKIQFNKADEEFAYLALASKINEEEVSTAKIKVNDTLEKLCILGDKDAIRQSDQRKLGLNYAPVTDEEFYDHFLASKLNLPFIEFKNRLLALKAPTSYHEAIASLNAALPQQPLAANNPNAATQAALDDLKEFMGFGHGPKKSK